MNISLLCYTTSRSNRTNIYLLGRFEWICYSWCLAGIE